MRSMDAQVAGRGLPPGMRCWHAEHVDPCLVQAHAYGIPQMYRLCFTQCPCDGHKPFPEYLPSMHTYRLSVPMQIAHTPVMPALCLPARTHVQGGGGTDPAANVDVPQPCRQEERSAAVVQSVADPSASGMLAPAAAVAWARDTGHVTGWMAQPVSVMCCSAPAAAAVTQPSADAAMDEPAEVIAEPTGPPTDEAAAPEEAVVVPPPTQPAADSTSGPAPTEPTSTQPPAPPDAQPTPCFERAGDGLPRACAERHEDAAAAAAAAAPSIDAAVAADSVDVPSGLQGVIAEELRQMAGEEHLAVSGDLDAGPGAEMVAPNAAAAEPTEAAASPAAPASATEPCSDGGAGCGGASAAQAQAPDAPGARPAEPATAHFQFCGWTLPGIVLGCLAACAAGAASALCMDRGVQMQLAHAGRSLAVRTAATTSSLAAGVAAASLTLMQTTARRQQLPPLDTAPVAAPNVRILRLKRPPL